MIDTPSFCDLWTIKASTIDHGPSRALELLRDRITTISAVGRSEIAPGAIRGKRKCQTFIATVRFSREGVFPWFCFELGGSLSRSRVSLCVCFAFCIWWSGCSGSVGDGILVCLERRGAQWKKVLQSVSSHRFCTCSQPPTTTCQIKVCFALYLHRFVLRDSAL